ncbi:NAD(P)/FAD-dependent oxidoreductase [Amycolatopsis sp. NPDC059021]|uniref:NAD(P)/FAD-dependent oxidoreductase n=1 Tax=Amycolatopsis sp. NPDC059021 TaxID=3346704 RepID=UPI00366C6B23
MTKTRARYDVVIAGGGGAGLGAALMLGRARRSVLVVDGGQPRNAPAEHMHGFLSRDGMPPGELLETGRREVEGYGGEIVTGQVVSAAGTSGAFTVELDDGSTVEARRLLVATGLTDELPAIHGLAARWGRDVLHCPYCHGWEVRDQPIGILATGPMAMHQALLFRQWSADVTFLMHTAAKPADDELEQLTALRIPVVPDEVTAVTVTGDRLSGVRLSSGLAIPLSALVVAPRFTARADFLAPLGLEPAPHPTGMGTYLAADADGQTSVPGVWAAGNVTDPRLQVLASAAAGATAAGAINADLVSEDVQNALTERNAL